MKRTRSSMATILTPLLLTLSPAASATPAQAAADTFKLSVVDAGVYAVSFEDLASAGLSSEVATAELAMTHLGEPHPIWIEDGGDGVFGSGDRIEWVGEHLPGDRSYYNEKTPLNVYVLQVAESGGARHRARAAIEEPRPRKHRLQVEEHLEDDELLLRFRPVRGEVPELWYWHRLTHVDQAPMRIPLDLGDYHAKADRPLSITLEFRGWSTAGYAARPRSLSDRPAKTIEPTGMPDHLVKIAFNGELLTKVEWSGQEAYRVEIPEIPERLIRRRNDKLELRVPVRRPTPDGDPIIDVVMLNWVEIRYPRKTRVEAGQHRISILDGQGSQRGEQIALVTDDDRPLLVFGDNGERIRTRPTPAKGSGKGSEEANHYRHGFDLASEKGTVWVTRADDLRSPIEIVADHPSTLRAKDRQADYLMITHPRLRDSLEPLAAMHRERGLSVEMVDVVDIYDEFSHGILDPQAIQDFIGWAYHEWQKPAPRFVLLAGDASWDSKHSEPDDGLYGDQTYRPRDAWNLSKNQSTSYEETKFRNLIPTWDFASSAGHAASDNYFVTVDGDDFKPDLAIGRFPVTEPEEVAAVVAKIKRYVEEPEIGPWRRQMLWITNEAKHYQNNSDKFAKLVGDRGYSSTKIYPNPQEKNNAEHQANLRRAFDAGNLIVHFIGHGGRYIWRTGPPDLEKNHDLFTLDDLEELTPTRREAFVLSMTCYSAPFDHPTADSIGEKFLRLPERGAIGIFAASWRNNPPLKFSQLLLEAILSEETYGEAIMEVKHQIGNRELVGTYNLLGDPATPVPRPEMTLTVATRSISEPPTIQVEVPDEQFEGQAVIDWTDEAGDIVATEEMVVSSSRFEASFEATPDAAAERVAGARVYVWNATDGIDGLGAAVWSDDESSSDAESAPASASGSR